MLSAANKIELQPEGHIYRVDGVIKPSNTQILEDQGIIDLDGIPPERLAYKSALGTAVHYAIHLHETNNLDEASIHPEIAPFFQAYKKFAEVNRFEPRHTELALYSQKWNFCTTLDLQGPFMWKGIERESIIELKCTFSMRVANAIQTAGQKIAFEETYKKTKIKGRFGLQLKGTGNYDVHEYKDPRDEQVFLGALICHRFRMDNNLLKKNGGSNANDR